MIMEQPVDTLVTQSIARVRKAQRPRKQRSKGLLVAEGDSWFDYFSYDILRKLEHYGFDIRCVANHGDKLRDMARLETQHDKLASVLERLNRQNRVPKAVLVSAGGNDLAEECVLRTLLNDASWGGPILNEEAVRGFINVRLRKNYLLLLEFITALCVRIFGDGTRIPIVIHGYGHPVPDGRGVGFFNEPGPWLEPEFKARVSWRRSQEHGCDDGFDRSVQRYAGGASRGGWARSRAVRRSPPVFEEYAGEQSLREVLGQ